MDERVWHYVKRNEVTRVPKRHIFLDCEAQRARAHGREVQTWRLAVATFVANSGDRSDRDLTREYQNPAELWADVVAFTRRKRRTVVWTHNLGYDLRVSQAFEHLSRLGWTLRQPSLNSRGAWVDWRLGDRTLLLVDSTAVFPTTLAAVGMAVGLGKLALPDDDDSDEAWSARCRQDVVILRTAVLEYLRWLETEDLGNWQVSGSGQSWATFRHRHMTHRMLVHADEDALAAERRAMWTGRTEAYWHGALPLLTVHEWDLSLCYARVAAEVEVPVRLLGPLPAGVSAEQVTGMRRVAAVADVRVKTTEPVVPARHEGRIVWPVGEFETTLWTPEIAAALRAGAQVEIVRGWAYRTAPALRQWADWVIGELEDTTGTVPAWRKIVVKHWARALIGRFAMTYSAWDHFGTVPGRDLRRSMLVDERSGQCTDMLQVGNEVFTLSDRQEWPHSMPAVTGFIMSEARVRLWDIIEALSPNTVLYADTDSIFTREDRHEEVSELASSWVGRGLRLKRTWQGFACYGPRRIVTGQRARMSGLPHNATQTGRHEWQGEQWESLDKATKRGHWGEVHIKDIVWRNHVVDHRRTETKDGWTAPIHVGP